MVLMVLVVSLLLMVLRVPELTRWLLVPGLVWSILATSVPD